MKTREMGMTHLKVAHSVVKSKPSSTPLLGKQKKKDGKSAPSKKHSGGKKESWSDWTKKHVGKGASWAWDKMWRHLFGKVPAQLKLIQEKLAASEKLDWQYCSNKKGEKEEDSDTTRLLKMEVQLLKESVMRTVGFKPVAITLRLPFTLTTTVTSGVLATVVSCVPGSSGEFASLAALFDEYKCVSGHVQFVEYIRSKYTFGTTAADLNSSMLALCFDNDSTALASVISAPDYAQHELYPVNYSVAGVIVVPASIHKFHFRVPPGVGVDTVTPALDRGSWAPTSNASLSYGFIKSYCATTEVVSLAVVQGILHLNCEFRTRE